VSSTFVSGCSKRNATLAQLVERLIRNLAFPLHAIEFIVGCYLILLAYSAYRALIEPDFEPDFQAKKVKNNSTRIGKLRRI